MQLYSFPGSTSARKALLVARHLDLDLKVIPVDLNTGEQRSPAFLARNPLGKVPVLVDGELVLTEAAAIAVYFAEAAGSLLPPGQGRHAMRQWVSFECMHWARACADIHWERLFKEKVQGEPADESALVGFLVTWTRLASHLDAHLSSRPFLCDTLSVADFLMAGDLTWAEAAGMPVHEHTALSDWFARMQALPAWQQTLLG